jgi:hypothetical protein
MVIGVWSMLEGDQREATLPAGVWRYLTGYSQIVYLLLDYDP